MAIKETYCDKPRPVCAAKMNTHVQSHSLCHDTDYALQDEVMEINA